MRSMRFNVYHSYAFFEIRKPRAYLTFPGWWSLTFFSADTGGAVLPYAGNCLAIDGFSFFGGNDVAEAVNQNMAVCFGGN